MDKTLLRLDASACGKSSCDLRLRYIVIDGYREELPFNDTQYGSSVHKFMSEMVLSKADFKNSLVAALELFRKPCKLRPKKDHLNENHFIKTCFDYWEHLSKSDDFEIYFTEAGKALVEQKFAIKMYEDESLIIEVAGTIDKVGKFNKGMSAIGDYKITSSWDTRNYFLQHRLGPQLKTYRWALFKLAEQSPEGSVLRQITKYPVGMFIDAVFISSSKETTFERSEVWNPKAEEIYEFNELIERKVTRLKEIFYSKEIPSLYNLRDGMINGSCSNSYGTTSSNGALCQFYNVCSAQDSIARAHILKNNFIVREYNPLMFGED